MNNYKLPAVLMTCLMLAACDTSLPSEENANNSAIESGAASSVSNQEYQSLSAVEKYQVASKLAASVYKGIPVEDFFVVSNGLGSSPQTTEYGNNYIANFNTSIDSKLDDDTLLKVRANIEGLDENGNASEDLRKYDFSTNGQPKEEPFALIKDYPLSEDSFIAAMALFLSNTIMFTCAEEMESTNVNDCQKTYNYLVTELTKNSSIQSIVRGYLPSVMNWRIGRSGQNVGVEGLEEFLGLFDRAKDADKVGIACKNVILLPEDQNYELSSTNFPNTEPQVILQDDTNGDGIGDSGGYFITTCDDFYNVVVGHPLLVPRVCEVISNYYLAERPLETRLALCESIVAHGAITFSDLFKGIIFSEEYLLRTERVKGFDEFLLPTLDALKWDVKMNSYPLNEDIFRYLATDQNSPLYMGAMGWYTMTLKIGRLHNVPVDPLSFVEYHNALRQYVLMNTSAYAGRRISIDGVDVYIPGLLYISDEVLDPSLDTDDVEDSVVKPEIAALSPRDYLSFLFLTVLKRQPTAQETDSLLSYFGSDLIEAPDIHDQDGDGNSTEIITVNRSYWRVSAGQAVVNDWAHDDMARATFDYISRLPETYYFSSIN
ncbi:MAG: hypothetical protein JXA04_01745 [Gammaproteobacteria bacterium]|nr:hypothetical protein [Gammaproteobacteria bacterium]